MSKAATGPLNSDAAPGQIPSPSASPDAQTIRWLHPRAHVKRKRK